MDDQTTREIDTKLNIFVSHAAEDMELARILQNAIERVCDPDNVDVFLDYDHIKFGAEIPAVIKIALSKSDFFIGIATHNLRNQFSWCGLELGYFLLLETDFNKSAISITRKSRT